MKKMLKNFKDFFSNLTESFLAKLLDPSKKYDLEFIFLYYSNFAIPKMFQACVRYFYQIFVVHQMIALQKPSQFA